MKGASVVGAIISSSKFDDIIRAVHTFAQQLASLQWQNTVATAPRSFPCSISAICSPLWKRHRGATEMGTFSMTVLDKLRQSLGKMDLRQIFGIFLRVRSLFRAKGCCDIFRYYCCYYFICIGYFIVAKFNC